jgi:hypothetical protein
MSAAMAVRRRGPGRLSGETRMNDLPLYSDHLVTLSNDAIIFHRYYFPIYTSKVVLLSDIMSIVSKEPTLWNGKWRLHGSGDLKTWFPADFLRFRRKRIFFATLLTQRVKIGFTVEDSDQFEKALGHMNLLTERKA